MAVTLAVPLQSETVIRRRITILFGELPRFIHGHLPFLLSTIDFVSDQNEHNVWSCELFCIRDPSVYGRERKTAVKIIIIWKKRLPIQLISG
jgi:hypothetical protein